MVHLGSMAGQVVVVLLHTVAHRAERVQRQQQHAAAACQPQHWVPAAAAAAVTVCDQVQVCVQYQCHHWRWPYAALRPLQAWPFPWLLLLQVAAEKHVVRAALAVPLAGLLEATTCPQDAAAAAAAFAKAQRPQEGRGSLLLADLEELLTLSALLAPPSVVMAHQHCAWVLHPLACLALMQQGVAAAAAGWPHALRPAAEGRPPQWWWPQQLPDEACCPSLQEEPHCLQPEHQSVWPVPSLCLQHCCCCSYCSCCHRHRRRCQLHCQCHCHERRCGADLVGGRLYPAAAGVTAPHLP